MKENKYRISLLDCTLRDGGYVNDWKFGSDNLCNIFERLIDSKVDIVEMGFLDERRPFDQNRSIMPDTKSVERIYGKVKKRPPMTVGMIDYGTCGISNLEPCKDSLLDGIRVIFKKYRMHEAMAFCAEVKKLGYKVFAQLVSITSYSDEELLEEIGLANEVRPYALSIVDTYGLLDPDGVRHLVNILDSNLDREIGLGFHAHNNLQLAYANTLTFLEETGGRRNVVVDGSLYGMGKNAGNAPLELLADHLNGKYGKKYQLSPVLEAINESILDFYQDTPWGYKMYFYLCAHNHVHPDYVKQLQKKPSLSLSALDQVLGEIGPEENKLLYNHETGEGAWEKYKSSAYDDEENDVRFRRILSEKKHILLLGPGRSITLQRDIVSRFVEKEDPLAISINYIPEGLPVDCVFVTKPKRYLQLTEKLLESENQSLRIIATSNIVSKDKPFSIVFTREPLLETNENIVDNSLLMLLRILKRCGVNELYLAGFDGYSDRDENYYNPRMEYSFIRSEAGQLNRHIKNVLENEYSNIKFNFLTFSRYTMVQDSYDAAF